MSETIDPVAAAQLVPSVVSTKQPVKAAVTVDEEDGTVTFTFVGRLREVENFVVSLEHAVEMRGRIPVSATILTPGSPVIVRA